MQPLFFVTSAIHTSHGKFSAEERLNQTITTLESIKNKVPDSRIILLDSSATESLNNIEGEKLKPYLAGLLNFHEDQQVQDIFKMAGANWDVAKNLTEINVFIKALDFVIRKQPQLLEEVNRVFKLSGRYILNDNFSLETHLKAEENYVFATRRTSQFPANVTGGLTQQVMSRLWSWNPTKTAYVFFRYNLMLEDFLSSMNKKQYRDIEHLLFRYFEGPNLLEIPIIGVEGKLGPNGIVVKD